MKTLSEYITAEFGIIPDEVQLEQIREIVNKDWVINRPYKSKRIYTANRWGNSIETVIVNTGGFIGFKPNVSDFPQTTSDAIIIGNKDF
jgi:hypothetical protein